jgi:hypothetical protein
MKKYLPLMRDAVKNKNASPKDLALLEDRTAISQGKKQIYGSQIGRNDSTQKFFVRPIEDPDNVDKRRASIGLEPMAEYLTRWDILWNLNEHKSGNK